MKGRTGRQSENTIFFSPGILRSTSEDFGEAHKILSTSSEAESRGSIFSRYLT